jgi:putative addiction module killer protein
VIELRRYQTRTGRDVFGQWLAGLNDNRTRAKIIARIDRLQAGNFGDCRSLRGGLFELRIDWGPGYRVYYATIGRTCVLLLCGGDKRKQSSDIKRAGAHLRDYLERTRTP